MVLLFELLFIIITFGKRRRDYYMIYCLHCCLSSHSPSLIIAFIFQCYYYSFFSLFVLLHKGNHVSPSRLTEHKRYSDKRVKFVCLVHKKGKIVKVGKVSVTCVV